MKIENRSTDFTLTAASIDEIAQEVEIFLYAIDLERANVLRVRLSIEEALLRWQEHFGEEVTLRFLTGRRWRRPYITLELTGETCDPLKAEGSEMGAWSETLLSGVGLSPKYSYQRGTNTLSFRLRQPQKNPAINLVIALVIGLLVGAAGSALLPQSIINTLIHTTLDPIQALFFRILNVAAGPVIFFSLVVSICGMGNLAAGGKAGRKMVLRFLAGSTVLAVLTLSISAPLFSLSYHDTALSDTGFASVLDFFLQVFPNDVFSPFVSGNSPQIVLLAIVAGNAILVAGTQTDGLTSLVEQLNSLCLLAAGWVGLFSPFFLSILLILGLWSGSLQPLLGCWKPILLFFLLATLAASLWIIRVSRVCDVSFTKLLKKILPSFQVALKTASVDAAFGDNQFCCEKRLGIPSSMTTTSLPLGLVVFMPANTMVTTVFTVYTAKCYEIVISGVWCVTALALTVMLITASPPMAGVNLLAYVAIFSRLGIPSEGLTVAIIADILFGFFTAAVNQAMLQMELVLQAHRRGELNQALLKK